MNEQICAHLSAIKTIKQATGAVCEECIRQGTTWLHLRTCQTCQKTLCCDSSSEQHMSHHCRSTGHPVVISSEPGERWLYCYVDDQMAGY